MPFLDEFCAAMILSASKRVTRTDVGKASYVPSFEQREVMSAAGVAPQPHTTGRTIPIRLAGTSEILDTTYYPSVRVGSGREPEMRMGRGLVHWM